MKRALIYLDPDAPLDSLQLTGVVEQMYGAGRCELFGAAVEPLPAEAIDALDHIFYVGDGRIGRYDVENISNAIAELQGGHAFDAVVILATTFGRMVAPRLAMRLHVGLVADVTEIRRDGAEVQLVRPAFSGRMLAAIVNRGDGPIMMSVRPNTFSRGEAAQRDAAHSAAMRGETSVTTFLPQRDRAPRVRLIERREKSESYDIRESEVLISGGGGVMRHFDKLEALAKELDGMVSASRRVVDSGKAPRHIQVGQSGKTVSPRLYLAVGISGSIQHVVGLKNAECIIAVNNNRHAPICSLADLVVEGDAREFIERTVERIRRDGSVPPSPRKTIHLSQTDGGDR